MKNSYITYIVEIKFDQSVDLWTVRCAKKPELNFDQQYSKFALSKLKCLAISAFGYPRKIKIQINQYMKHSDEIRLVSIINLLR